MIDVVRFRHRQRCRIINKSAQLITFECGAGKRYHRRSGQRHAFRYCVPRVWAPGQDLAEPLLEFLEGRAREAGVCPGLKLGPSRRLESDAIFLNKPMTYRQFSALLQGSLMLIGHSAESAARFNFNSVRRVLLSAADSLEISDADAQAIGNWQDVLKGIAQRASRAGEPMCRRYAEGKVSFTGVVKGRVLAAVYSAARRWLQEHRVQRTTEGYWPADAMTWEDLRTCHVETSIIVQAFDHPSWNLDGMQAAGIPQGPPPRAEPPRPPYPLSRELKAELAAEQAKSSSSSASSSSASEAENDPEPPKAEAESPRVEVVSAQEQAQSSHPLQEDVPSESLWWFIQGVSTVHLIATHTELGRPVPVCRREAGRAFANPPTSMGGGPLPIGMDICGSCMKRLPAGAVSESHE